VRVELSAEAIRLARILQRLQPDHAEAAGLLALLLLTDARRRARTGPAGELIPLHEQDRSLWDRAAIAEGGALVTAAIGQGRVGSYQLQAAIASLHDEAPSFAATDWPQILALYGLLQGMSDNPMVRLNRAIAAAMVHGPATGLALLAELDGDRRLAGHYRLDAVRAHLHELAGDAAAAIRHYRAAAAGSANDAERRYLAAQAARLAPD
jgi:predicted RNA polymerase sigma factor